MLVYSFHVMILLLFLYCCRFLGTKLGYHKKDDNVAGGGKSFRAYVAVLLIDFLCIAVPYILYLTVSIQIQRQ